MTCRCCATTTTAYIDVAVVGVAHETMISARQLLIHFIKHHVGQQRGQRAALRRSLLSRADQPVIHDAAVQESPHQMQDPSIRDAPAQPVHQDVVIDPIKERLQIHIHHERPYVSSCQVALLLVRSFVGHCRLLRPLLTPRSGSTPLPFVRCAHPSLRSGPACGCPAPRGLVRIKVRSPRVRTHSFAAQP